MPDLVQENLNPQGTCLESETSPLVGLPRLWLGVFAKVVWQAVSPGAIYLLVAGAAVIAITWWAGQGQWGLTIITVGSGMLLHLAATMLIVVVAGALALARQIQRAGLIAEVARSARASLVAGPNAIDDLSHAEFRRTIVETFDEAIVVKARRRSLWDRFRAMVFAFAWRRVRNVCTRAIDAAAGSQTMSFDGWLAVSLGAAADQRIASGLRVAALQLIWFVFGQFVLVIAIAIVARMWP